MASPELLPLGRKRLIIHVLPVGKGSREILRTQHIVGLQPGRCESNMGLAWFRPRLSDLPRWWAWLSEGRDCDRDGTQEAFSLYMLSSQGRAGAIEEGLCPVT